MENDQELEDLDMEADSDSGAMEIEAEDTPGADEIERLMMETDISDFPKILIVTNVDVSVFENDNSKVRYFRWPVAFQTKHFLSTCWGFYIRLYNVSVISRIHYYEAVQIHSLQN